ncbi:hypothetical protein Selin_1507 [Desulfurispirillum indicum S5]|uniref:Uncharacterized protein n=1 Tax=Desulfurispirillum indicum (strain ATCC BAA-1389 / DSM 22839 / S5) TaxID=653733 RepID=E6W773_DESIS|nr:hypothetical protein Selin_1507 [Desulfurispirillum indicum S5]
MRKQCIFCVLDSSGITFRFRILPFLTAQKGHKNAPPERPFFRLIACLFWRSGRHCVPAVLPDHSLPVSVPFGSCQPGVALTGRAQGGTACSCFSPVCWPSQDAKTGTLWTRRVDATRAATANQKPRRAVVCGPQFQASGRLIRTALGVASQPLFAGKKWQKKLVYMVRIMSSNAVCAEPLPPFQHGIRVGADNLQFRR